MQSSKKIPNSTDVPVNCLADCEAEAEQVVVFELLVPISAKVPAPRQHVEVAKLLVRQASITSTVPADLNTDLRANNTALGLAWCITATLAATPLAGLSSRY
ncbi:MAG: hypothetical protein NVSMB30_01830 [Hymenobacter sp.]